MEGKNLEDKNLENKNLEDKSLEEDGEAAAKKAFEQDRCRGEELRQWQVQERAERLQALSASVSELARRLLMAHPGWEIQEQVHLDHASLEARARPEAEAVVVECRWAEDAQWRGLGAVEATVARSADFRVAGTPEAFEYKPGWQPHDREPLLLEPLLLKPFLMELLVHKVEQEVISQALIALQTVTHLAPRAFYESQ